MKQGMKSSSSWLWYSCRPAPVFRKHLGKPHASQEDTLLFASQQIGPDFHSGRVASEILDNLNTKVLEFPWADVEDFVKPGHNSWRINVYK